MRVRGSWRDREPTSGGVLVSIPLGFITRWAYVSWAAIPFVWRIQNLVDRLRHRPLEGRR